MPTLFDPGLDPSIVEGEGVPLDMGQPQPAAPASGKTDWKKLAPILAALPLVLAKSGRVGGAAFLRGIEQSRQQRGEETRRNTLDAENRQYRADTLAATRDSRAATAANAAATRTAADEAKRQTFFQQFNQAMGELDNPDAVSMQMPLWQARARSLGISDPLEFAPTPVALSQRKAAKELEELKAQPKTKSKKPTQPKEGDLP